MTTHPASRFGLMVPANNTTMEREIPGWTEGGYCEVVRIPRPPGLLTREDIPAYVDQALRLSTQFANEPVDVVIYGCTAAGILAGPALDAQIGEKLSEQTGKPVVTTATSTARWLQERQLKQIALLTPYSDTVNQSLIEFLGVFGIGVEVLHSMQARDTAALGEITAEQVERAARSLMNDHCDGMFIACSQLPTASVRQSLEADFGRPVSSSIHATAVYAMQAKAGQAAS
jgi:maleate cis-trans isomerase